MSEEEYASYLALQMDGDHLHRFIQSAEKKDVTDRLRKKGTTKLTLIQSSRLTDSEGQTSQEIVENAFATLLLGFSHSLSSVYHTISITAYIRTRLYRRYTKSQLIDFAEERLDYLQKYRRARIFGIKTSELHDASQRIKDVRHFSDGTQAFPGLVLMGLVARFDAQISSLIRLLLKRNPATINSAQADIDVSTIMDFNDIESLKDHVIDREISRVMYSSHGDQIQYIEKTFSIDVIRKIANFPAFLEVFERRNLVAHGEEVVNERYISKCAVGGVPEGIRLKVGESIRLTPSYLFESTDTLYEFGFLLIWWLWLKVEKNDAELAYDIAIDATFDLILEGRHKLASNIISSILSRKDGSVSELALRVLCINRAICEKNLDNKNWRKELERFNWEACSANYLICISAVDENVEKVCSMMALVSDDKVPEEARVTIHAFRTWPAFQWVRDDKQFRSKFLEVFGEEFESTGNVPEKEEPSPDSLDSVTD